MSARRPTSCEPVLAGHGTGLVAAVLALWLAVPVWSQGEAAGSEPEAGAAQEGAITDAADDEEPGAEDATPPRPCAPPDDDGERRAWIDRLRGGVHRSVCASALWFDSLFGDDRLYQERNETFGSVLVSTRWQEARGVQPAVRFRARIQLPQMDRKLSLLVGRAHEEDVVEDASDAFSALPQAFRDASDQDGFIGLGWDPVSTRRRRFGVSAGASFRKGPEPYVKAIYRVRWFLGGRAMVRLRETVFWTRSDQTGTSTRLDVDRLISRETLLRWRLPAKYSQNTEGVELTPSVTLFHALSPRRALGYQLHARGETDRAVPLERYGFRVIYRQRIARDWLFADVRPGVSWIRDGLEAERRSVPEIAFGFELQFGERR